MLFFLKKKITFKFNNLKFFSIIPFFFVQKLYKELIYIINKKNIVFSLNCLKLHLNYQYKILSCISGIDLLYSFINYNYRFSIVYELLSLHYNTRVKIKIFINELSTILSSTTIFINSNWWEREIWDMFGIWFDNHPDLRRILTDYGFDGFPLRKDFPLIGYSEILYNFNKKRIITKPCEFSQEFRFFFFENSWS
jgi:NADH dehydrogenase (ubiquinone) Fe-S protein 3